MLKFWQSREIGLSVRMKRPASRSSIGHQQKYHQSIALDKAGRKKKADFWYRAQQAPSISISSSYRAEIRLRISHKIKHFEWNSKVGYQPYISISRKILRQILSVSKALSFDIGKPSWSLPAVYIHIVCKC